jgi:hypothetical protein
MWNIDGRNKEAITLFSPVFCELPEPQCQLPMTMGQRIRRVLSYIWGSMRLFHEKTDRRLDRL